MPPAASRSRRQTAASSSSWPTWGKASMFEVPISSEDAQPVCGMKVSRDVEGFAIASVLRRPISSMSKTSSATDVSINVGQSSDSSPSSASSA